ncbi:hypothetical protein [Pseudomonas putida]|uniref:hypothetical protein n=1 Tax=Pseudomonas putida TaxID=303 RepID=UPI001E61067B|nr:hypothetical protein [Pseudomonas putida]MCE0975124.1 hypothetical protein [Pseudomonas putida]
MSEVVQLVISSETDAFAAVEQALEGKFDDQSVMIQFDGWPYFDVDIKGARYHSSLPTGVLKSFIEYQNAMNRAFASVAYGKTAKGMSDEDRKDIELVFEIHEGTTDANAALVEPLTKLGEKAIERMTGRQLVLTILGAALILGGAWTAVHWMDKDAEVKIDAQKSALMTRVLVQNEHLAQLQADVSKSAMTLVKGAHDADRIKYGDVTLEKEQIDAINQRGRVATVPSRMDGHYQVLQLKRLDDRWRIVLYNEVQGQFQTDLFRGQNAAKCIEEISTAFARHTTVDLFVLGRFKSGAVQSATILGSKGHGLIVPDVAPAPDADEDESVE